MTPQDYIDGSGAWLETNGFFEREIGVPIVMLSVGPQRDQVIPLWNR